MNTKLYEYLGANSQSLCAIRTVNINVHAAHSLGLAVISCLVLHSSIRFGSGDILHAANSQAAANCSGFVSGEITLFPPSLE